MNDHWTVTVEPDEDNPSEWLLFAKRTYADDTYLGITQCYSACGMASGMAVLLLERELLPNQSLLDLLDSWLPIQTDTGSGVSGAELLQLLNLLVQIPDSERQLLVTAIQTHAIQLFDRIAGAYNSGQVQVYDTPRTPLESPIAEALVQQILSELAVTETADEAAARQDRILIRKLFGDVIFWHFKCIAQALFTLIPDPVHWVYTPEFDETYTAAYQCLRDQIQSQR